MYIIAGPERTYRVGLVKRDTNRRQYWHVLTDCGRHFIFPERALAIVVDGPDNPYIEVFNLKRGDEITIRIRGTGVYALGLEEDPFGLREEKK